MSWIPSKSNISSGIVCTILSPLVTDGFVTCGTCELSLLTCDSTLRSIINGAMQLTEFACRSFFWLSRMSAFRTSTAKQSYSFPPSFFFYLPFFLSIFLCNIGSLPIAFGPACFPPRTHCILIETDLHCFCVRIGGLVGNCQPGRHWEH